MRSYDHEPPQTSSNDHKPPANNHKPPAITTTNYQQATTNGHTFTSNQKADVLFFPNPVITMANQTLKNTDSQWGESASYFHSICEEQQK